jgi:hypothetical protein
METMMGLGPLISALIALHLAALVVWIALLLRTSAANKTKKTVKTH